ncbi:tautomerase family protein [Rhizobium sp. MC63]|uniref:Tautomerase family protein n=1 Tax=Rhizobium mulingense TaxID=3031128 RepID=A0ACC6N2N1_9HYPH|nr:MULTISPECIES: tautomerase family protein [unclassified Rhizobium]MDF0699423.1 tautomerase family protein [Rhizobium sp. MC63]MEA3519740.1 tautomerase family protein [Rhizobium sp. MJ31]PDV86033.1 tautomerase family protein [Rhizobium sp. H4]
MPLMKFHIYRGRSAEQIDTLLDAAHDAMVRSFNVPERDRYQILNEHEPSHLRALDTGLDIPRTDRFVMVEVVSRPRSTEEKTTFYEALCSALQERCGTASTDVMVSFTQNTDEDWSFGRGRAQFLVGEL